MHEFLMELSLFPRNSTNNIVLKLIVTLYTYSTDILVDNGL